MAKKKVKLSLDQIIKDDVQYDKLTTVTFENGSYTEVYAKFRPTKIDEMLLSLSEFMTEYEKTGLVIKEKDIVDYTNLHMILFFSTLVGVIPTNISQKLEVFKKMLNNKLVEKTFESFDPAEVTNVFNVMNIRLESVQKEMETNVELRKQFRDKIESMNLENKDIINGFLFGEKDDKGDDMDGFQQSE